MMKKIFYIIFALLFLLTGCTTYLKLSGLDKKIEATVRESASLAALAITYHQANGAWPTTSDQIDSYFSNINIDPSMIESQKAIDDCLYYLSEVQPIEFYSSSNDKLTLTYKNYKNRDVWIYLTTNETTQDTVDKSYSFSTKIQIPSDSGTMNESISKKSYLSKDQIDNFIALVGFIALVLNQPQYTYIPY